MKTPVLKDDMLQRFAARAPAYDRENRFFTEDFEELRESKYLLLAVPEQFGGGGRTLAEVVREQRRLGYYAAPTALAVNMHLYWTGVAADLWRSGDKSLLWLLEEAAHGEIFAAGHAESGNDIPALAELRRATGIPLASGQMIQSVTWFRDALAAGALDILQPNAAFCGGISAMLRILALAEAQGIPVGGAGGFEAANLPVMAGHAHGGMLEVHGAHAALRERFATEPQFRDGKLHVPAAAGLGFSLRD